MTNTTALFKLLKNLIENKEFEQAFALREKFSSLNRPIYNSLLYYNFGNALFEAENALFQELEDENFLSIEESDNAFEDENEIDNRSNYHDEPDYKRDYFDAMTDGQLGDYDDYRENGGNIDDIDTWARG